MCDRHDWESLGGQIREQEEDRTRSSEAQASPAWAWGPVTLLGTRVGNKGDWGTCSELSPILHAGPGEPINPSPRSVVKSRLISQDGCADTLVGLHYFTLS